MKSLTLFKPGVGSTTGGQGLGLSISRTIVEAHGGKLWARNAEDGGASFFFTLPKGAES
jgi:two-component system sensor kinase FixL